MKFLITQFSSTSCHFIYVYSARQESFKRKVWDFIISSNYLVFQVAQVGSSVFRKLEKSSRCHV
jgi:hypothetical protein